jgi:hypothetical protein
MVLQLAQVDHCRLAAASVDAKKQASPIDLDRRKHFAMQELFKKCRKPNL